MSRWPDWFRQWQQQFYHRVEWLRLRNQVREDAGMRCAKCRQLVKGKGIVDHIIEITPDNYMDESVTLSADNLEYLCLECHNAKTFGDGVAMAYDTSTRKDVNLF